jgi:hypothetical protein
MSNEIVRATVEKVRVTVLDPSGSNERKVGIPISWTVERFIREFSRKLNLPNADEHNQLVSYEAVLKRTGNMLDPQKTIQEGDIQEGDIIRLRARQEGGGKSRTNEPTSTKTPQ